jgi:folate-binding protein YgfZ
MTDAYLQAREHAAFFDHSERGKVVVGGPDARTFLHNLSTNDIKSLRPGTGCEAFFATAQAKAVASALVFGEESEGRESFWLDLEPGLSEKVVRHLDRFIISEQVELADRSAEFGQWHVAGPDAEAVLARAALGSTCRIRRWDRIGLPGWDVLCHRADNERVRQALIDASVTPAGPEIFNVLRVEAGVPLYGVDIDDNRFVVEAGRTTQAISYTKGCYLGQEPIVMARDRGHVNRMLMGLRIARGDVPTRDTSLFREGKEVGQITSSVASPRFGVIALAYLRRGNSQPGTVVEISAPGAPQTAEVVSLPFSFSLGKLSG